jgi:hypothetical protein
LVRNRVHVAGEVASLCVFICSDGVMVLDREDFADREAAVPLNSPPQWEESCILEPLVSS